MTHKKKYILSLSLILVNLILTNCKSINRFNPDFQSCIENCKIIKEDCEIAASILLSQTNQTSTKSSSSYTTEDKENSIEWILFFMTAGCPQKEYECKETCYDDNNLFGYL